MIPIPEKDYRAEGALSSGCTTTDYSLTVLECPQDVHRGCSERYPDLFPTWEVALNRHAPAKGIVLAWKGAVGRVPRAYGGSNARCLMRQTPVLRCSRRAPAQASSDCELARPRQKFHSAKFFAPKAHFHPGVPPPTTCTVQPFWSVRATLTGAVRSDIQTCSRHGKSLKIAMDLDLG